MLQGRCNSSRICLYAGLKSLWVAGGVLTVTQKTEWEREDCLFSSVSAVLRLAEPRSNRA